MAYSCSDFTDDILRKLNITAPNDGDSDPSALADLALEKIEALQSIVGSLSRMTTCLDGIDDEDTTDDILAERGDDDLCDAESTLRSTITDARKAMGLDPHHHSDCKVTPCTCAPFLEHIGGDPTADEIPGDVCTFPAGHSFVIQGDTENGRSYCEHCNADGDA